MRIIFLLLILLFISCCAEEEQRATLLGHVLDGITRAPIVNAKIYTRPKTKNVKTNSQGMFALFDIKPGQYEIICYANNYFSYSKNVEIGRDHNTYEISILLFQPEQPDDISRGLVAYYPFNGNANDESGNGNHGIINGATLSKDRFGLNDRAFSFNGTSNKINIGTKQLFLSAFSISVWFKANSISDWSAIINQWAGYGWKKSGYYLGISPTRKICFTIKLSSSGGTYKIIENTINTQTWNHVVVTYRYGQLILYQNSLKISEIDVAGDLAVENNTPTYIGLQSDLNAYGFNGIIDDIRIYNRPLKESEVMSLYSYRN